MNKVLILALLPILSGCFEKNKSNEKTHGEPPETSSTSLIILGNVQDAGSPQIGCKKTCCASLFRNPDANRQVTCLGLIDSEHNKRYLFEATPDIGNQVEQMAGFGQKAASERIDGIFLTHAHIGHYTGLMYLGKEAMDAKEVPVYAMPRMKKFLNENGPWSQLVARRNVVLRELENQQSVTLAEKIIVTPLLVPHRDEFSETVGYRIEGPNKTALFIPDIDKWEKWEKDVTDEIKKVDYAFLDATFYSGAELNNRDMSEIPHPFVLESLERFRELSTEDKSKIVFIHFNHTNPLLNPESKESKDVLEQDFKIARLGDVFEL